MDTQIVAQAVQRLERAQAQLSPYVVFDGGHLSTGTPIRDIAALTVALEEGAKQTAKAGRLLKEGGFPEGPARTQVQQILQGLAELYGRAKAGDRVTEHQIGWSQMPAYGSRVRKGIYWDLMAGTQAVKRELYTAELLQRIQGSS